MVSFISQFLRFGPVFIQLQITNGASSAWFPILPVFFRFSLTTKLRALSDIFLLLLIFYLFNLIFNSQSEHGCGQVLGGWWDAGLQLPRLQRL